MNISLTGRLGSGKSTICGIMKEKYGYEIYSTGKIQREIADGMGIDTLELNRRMTEDSSLDHIIDDAVRDISVKRINDRLIFDSRMAWHFAVSTFKVYSYVEPYTAAKRVAADELRGREQYSSLEDAKDKLEERATLECERFKKIYGVDYSDYSNYDLVIDTTFITAEEAAEIIKAEVGKFENGEYNGTKILVSPKAVYPALISGSKPEIKLCGGYNYILGGYKKFVNAASKGEKLIECYVSDKKVPKHADLKKAEKYQLEGGFEYECLPAIYKEKTL